MHGWNKKQRVECWLTVTTMSERPRPLSGTSQSLVCFRQHLGKLLQDSHGQLLLHRNRSPPAPPRPSGHPLVHRCSCPAACPLTHLLLCQQGALLQALWGAPSSKGSSKFPGGPGPQGSQSLFSSSFCKLFCIWRQRDIPHMRQDKGQKGGQPNC